MRQFFAAYRHHEKVSPLVRQLSWSYHLVILSQCKLDEEREFYIRRAIAEQWGKRELERQCRARAFQRAVVSPPARSTALQVEHPADKQGADSGTTASYLPLRRCSATRLSRTSRGRLFSSCSAA